MGSAGRFLVGAAVVSIGLIGLMTLLLQRNGELWTTRAGAAAQYGTSGIYGRSVWDDFFAYKFALYDLQPKKHISVGSSRAMSIRSVLFKDRNHLSFGGAVNSVEDLETFVSQTRQWNNKPATVFLYVDAEWFIAGNLPRRHAASRDIYDGELFLYQSAFVHLKSLTVNAFAPQLQADPRSGGRLIGSRAQRSAEGFRIDGTIRHHYYLTDYRPWPGDEIAVFLKDVDTPEATADARRLATIRGWWGAKTDDLRFRNFQTAIVALKSGGANLVLILAPVAPHLARALETAPELSFFRTTKSRLHAIADDVGVPILDYTATPLRNVSCYIDYYHASEGAMAAVLRDAQTRLPDPASAAFDVNALRKFSDEPCLREIRDARDD